MEMGGPDHHNRLLKNTNCEDLAHTFWIRNSESRPWFPCDFSCDPHERLNLRITELGEGQFEFLENSNWGGEKDKDKDKRNMGIHLECWIYYSQAEVYLVEKREYVLIQNIFLMADHVLGMALSSGNKNREKTQSVFSRTSESGMGERYEGKELSHSV